MLVEPPKKMVVTASAVPENVGWATLAWSVPWPPCQLHAAETCGPLEAVLLHCDMTAVVVKASALPVCGLVHVRWMKETNPYWKPYSLDDAGHVLWMKSLCMSDDPHVLCVDTTTAV